MIDRRRFVLGTVVAFLATPLTAEAQQAGKVYRIGFLSPVSELGAVPAREAFLQGLRDHGWVEGRTITLEFRFAEGRLDLLPGLATELVRLRPHVIVSASNAAVAALKQATPTIPIVMAVVGDPVGSGFVASLAGRAGISPGCRTCRRG